MPMTEHKCPVTHPVVDELVTIDIPLPGTSGMIYVDWERMEMSDVVGQTARNSCLSLTK
jgi:hypothetical protein